MFECSICGKTFNSSQAYAGHCSSHSRYTGMKNPKLTNYQQPNCLFCGKTIASHPRERMPKFCNSTCWHSYQKQKHNKRLVKIRHDTLNITYGELEEYYSTHPVCEICGKPESLLRKLAVDHDHTTKKFRGLLCYKCNTGIGYYENHSNQLHKYLQH